LIMEIAQDRDLIYNISPREFEEIIERVFQDEGFETTLTQQTRDGGRDIIATKFEMGKPVVFYIECKRYGRQNS
jgi:HJR/Mrr/RecB family endonuclease